MTSSPVTNMYGVYFIQGGFVDNEGWLLPVVKVGYGQVHNRAVDLKGSKWLDALQEDPFAVVPCSKPQAVKLECQLLSLFSNYIVPTFSKCQTLDGEWFTFLSPASQQLKEWFSLPRPFIEGVLGLLEEHNKLPAPVRYFDSKFLYWGGVTKWYHPGLELYQEY